jgi:hypothetical protein
VSGVRTSGDPDGTLAACVGAILERDDVPADPLVRGWLGTLRMGLVPILEPVSFSWPGPWVAVFGDGRAGVAFGAPPGLVWAPADARFEDVVEGYMIAPADVALWSAGPVGAPGTGVVEALAIAGTAEAEMVVVNEADAVAGHGLRGDRYFDGDGTFSNPDGVGHDLTLIDAALVPGAVAARRNVITRGIDLDALVGRRFMVGEVECVGQRLCEPCAHLERLTSPGTLRALVHIGGLRADVLSDGTIRAGDVVRPL